MENEDENKLQEFTRRLQVLQVQLRSAEFTWIKHARNKASGKRGGFLGACLIIIGVEFGFDVIGVIGGFLLLAGLLTWLTASAGMGIAEQSIDFLQDCLQELQTEVRVAEMKAGKSSEPKPVFLKKE